MTTTAEPKIGIDVRMADSPGIGTYLRQVLPRVVSARPNWQFTLVGNPMTVSMLGWRGHSNVRVWPLTAPIYSLREQLALRADRRRFDAFWAPHYNVPLGGRAPVVVTIHDLTHLTQPEYTHSPAKHAYARFMFEVVRRRAAAILTVSEFTRDEFLRVVGAPRAAMTVARNGVDRGWFAPSAAAQPSGARPYILSIASMKPHKNLPALIDAFGSICDRVPHDLVLVGRNDGLRTADDRVRKAASRVGERVRLLGAVDDDELHRLVCGATAFVFASLYEGFGLPPLEAMAAGRACVVARAGSIPEVCGDAALYFDPRDSEAIAARLFDVLTDDGLRAELAMRGQRRARMFDWTESAGAVVSALETAAGR